MTTRAYPKKAKVVKDLAAERIDKSLKGSLLKVEELAKKRILTARDPFITGLSIAREIRRIADNIDADVIALGLDDTEASVVLEEGGA